MQCGASSRMLQKHEIEYDYLDVGVDADALEFTKGLGYMQAPVLVIRDQDGGIVDSWSGFNPDKLKALAA